MMSERSPERRPRDWSWLIVLLAFGAPLLNQLNGWIGTGFSLPPMLFPLLVAIGVAVSAVVLIWRSFRGDGAPSPTPPPVAPHWPPVAPRWPPDAAPGMPPVRRREPPPGTPPPPVARLEPVFGPRIAALALVGLVGLAALALLVF